jgi:hypothetical protein
LKSFQTWVIAQVFLQEHNQPCVIFYKFIVFKYKFAADAAAIIVISKIPSLTESSLIGDSAVIAKIRSKLAISTGAACSSAVETPSMYFRL